MIRCNDDRSRSRGGRRHPAPRRGFLPMSIVRRPPSARPARRPRVEGLEDRRLLSTLPAGFSEAAVATGIANATAMELAPDGRLWVVEQGGQVDVFHGGSTAGSIALAIPSSAISSTGERGLLGIAFDPS